MPVGTLKPNEANQKVVEAARLLVGNMVRSRPYMMVIEDDSRQTVVGHFHTLHDIGLYARRHKLPKFSVWTEVGTSRLKMEADPEEPFDEYEDEYEDEQKEDGTKEPLDADADDDDKVEELEEDSDDELPPPPDDLDDLLGTDLPDLEEGDELDADDGII